MAKKKSSKSYTKKKVYVAGVVVPPEPAVAQQKTPVPAGTVNTAPVAQLTAPAAKEYVAPTLAPPAVVEKESPVPEAKPFTAPVKVENKKVPEPEVKQYTTSVTTGYRIGHVP
jgi:hypothetical protein